MKRISLIRHAETQSNADGLWQGHGDAPLTDTGLGQAEALGRRLADAGISRAVASDLGRTMETARLAGITPTPDAAWREVDIGVWEGLTRDEVEAQYSEDLEALDAGVDLPMGGGESWGALQARARDALAGLIDSMEDGEHVAVFTHGGVISTLVGSTLAVPRSGNRRAAIDRTRNTSVTELRVEGQGPRVRRYNDAAHLGSAAPALLSIVRHGESEANTRGEWHGTSDGPLSPHGHRQAGALAERVADIDHVYASPLERARATAEPLAAAHSVPLDIDEGLIEMDLGAWERMTGDEIVRSFPDEWAAVFDRGRDQPWGGTGETFAEASERARSTLDAIAQRHPGQRVAVVTHGMLILSLMSSVLGVGWSDSWRLAMPGNTEMAHLRYAEVGPLLVDYGL